MSTSSMLGINQNQTEVLALLWFEHLPFHPLVPPLKHLTTDHFLQNSVCFHHSNSQCLALCGHLLDSTPTEPHVNASVRAICRTCRVKKAVPSKMIIRDKVRKKNYKTEHHIRRHTNVHFQTDRNSLKFHL